jgi:uncharacterized lipoprotein YbaY
MAKGDMRTVQGKVQFPANAPTVKARRAIIEVRDVSEADAPSLVVAEQTLEDVDVSPGKELDFEFAVPEVEPGHTLAMRVHIDVKGTGRTESGDLLTTQNYRVEGSGTPEPMQVPVQVI